MMGLVVAILAVLNAFQLRPGHILLYFGYLWVSTPQRQRIHRGGLKEPSLQHLGAGREYFLHEGPAPHQGQSTIVFIFIPVAYQAKTDNCKRW